MSVKERVDMLNREIVAEKEYIMKAIVEQWYNKMFKTIFKDNKDVLDNFKVVAEKEKKK